MISLKLLVTALLVASTTAFARKNILSSDQRQGDISEVDYLLYTRSNADNAYVVEPFDQDSASGSGFDSSKPTYFLVHGFANSAYVDWVQNAKGALLEMFDCNVFAVDWQTMAAPPNYDGAASNVYLLADQTAQVIDWLNSDFGLDFSTLHLAGHSLGAHVVGVTGQNVANGLPSRVTGMDPAAPLFQEQDESMTISPSSGTFVDIIHSNAGDMTEGCLGLLRRVGHVDFYPNGGQHQPGCEAVIGGDITDMAQGCSHGRATEFWVESITAREPADNVFWSWQCSDYDTFASGGCSYSCDSGVCLQMGFLSIENAQDGEYYLNTGDASPFALGMAS